MAIKYFFRKGSDGETGEIPIIWLDAQEELLPINKVKTIEISPSYDLEESDLTLEWLLGDNEIAVLARCKVNNERLKKQFKENIELAERLIKLIVECQSLRSKKEQLFINEKVSEKDIPEKLKSYVTQAEEWKKSVGILKEKGALSPSYKSRIRDGYYYAVVHSDTLYIPGPVEQVSGEDIDFYSELPLIHFNPQKRPPQIDNNCIWWNLPNMVRIILPHHYATEEIVNYYGYREVYHQFLSEREGTRIAEEKRTKVRIKEHLEEQKQNEEKLRKILLS